MSNYDDSNTVSSDNKYLLEMSGLTNLFDRAALATVGDREAMGPHEEVTIATAYVRLSCPMHETEDPFSVLWPRRAQQ